jgi:hypothetical protein
LPFIPVYGSLFFHERLSNHYQGLRCTFTLICKKKKGCTLVVGSLEKSHQARYTTPNKRT